MRNTKKLLGVGLLAGVVIAGGSAFTASNDLSGVAGKYAGYGSTTVSGTTVDAVHYNASTTDPSTLASVDFHSTDSDTTFTNATIQMTLRDAADAVVGVYSCTHAASAGTVFNLLATGTDITCTTSDSPAIASFDSVGLTVTA